MNTGEGIPILDIAQSMGISNSFSVYTTVLPDTLNQEGLPTGEFPGTILAISQGYGIYLTWIGIYKNYLHVYSYHQGDSYEFTNYNDQKKGFISFDEMEGCAKEIGAKCKEAGVVLTGAGATYPYGKDPKDSNIRIAPSFPTPEEMAMATNLFVLCVKLVSVEKLLAK